MLTVHFVCLCTESLVELLIEVVEREPKVCEASHIGTLLSAYSATRSITGKHIQVLLYDIIDRSFICVVSCCLYVDCGLLFLLYKYEENGVSTSTYRYST